MTTKSLVEPEAWGIMLERNDVGVFGVCMDNNGKVLGQWFSSDEKFLASDLSNHAKEYNYRYVGEFVPEHIKNFLRPRNDNTKS